MQYAIVIDSIANVKLGNNDVNQVLHFLDSLTSIASNKNDKGLLYLLDIVRCYSYQYRNNVVDSATEIKCFDSLIQQSSKYKLPKLLISLNFQKTVFYLRHKNYGKAFEIFLANYQPIRNLPAEEKNQFNFLLYTMAELYYRFNGYDEAIAICKEYYNKNLHGWLGVITADIIGMSYLHKAQYNSARYWLNEVNRFTPAPGQKPLGWKGIVAGNTGYTYYLEGENEKAIEYLQRAVDLTEQDSLFDNVSPFSSYLASVYIKQNKLAEAKTYLEKAQSAAGLVKLDDNYYKYYQAAAAYYKKTGNTSFALQSMDSMLFYKEKIEAERDINFKTRAESQAFHLQKQQEIGELILQTGRQKWIRNFIIGILFMLMLLALLYYNRQRLKNLYRQQQLENEKLKAEEELLIASVHLEDFTKSLKEKNNLIEKFTAEIEKLQALPFITSEQTETLNRLRQSAILTDEDWETFRNNFEKVHSGFLQRLRLKLPDLSPAETRFIALAKLQLNNKEMAGILGVSTDAMRTIRYRLRKKLNLSEEGSIDELVNSI